MKRILIHIYTKIKLVFYFYNCDVQRGCFKLLELNLLSYFVDCIALHFAA